MNKMRKVFCNNNAQFDDFVGLFHEWSYDKNSYPFALVEKEDGTIIKVRYMDISFLPHEEQNSLKNYNKILNSENGLEEILNFGKGSRD